MFKALAKNRGFARISTRCSFAQPARLAASNDNAVTNRAVRQAQRLVLVGRWRLNEATGRLEWHWTVDPADGARGEDFGPPQQAALPVGHTRTVVFSRRAW
jgi:hypothetical protein